MGVLVLKDTVVGELTQAVEGLVAQAREEGRREVMRELAEMPEPLELGAVPAVFVPGWRHVDRCEWCHAETLANTRITHQPTCLWLRAAQAVKDAE